MDENARIFVTGHKGLVGSAVVRRLQAEGYRTIMVADRYELDLRDQDRVHKWMAEHRPTHVFHVAGTVGGIHANNTRPAEFIYDNLMMACTVIHAAHEIGVEKLLYLGSSCIYPKHAPQPMKEEYLLTGELEPTNEPYAIAKIAGIKLCQSYRRQYGDDFITAMPTNLYGPGDNFDLENSHVLPALIRKFHEAKTLSNDQVTLWGTGAARREFLHVDDLATACLFIMSKISQLEHINVGAGEDLTIRELAETVRSIVHPEAELTWDTSRPDGSPQKLLDNSFLHAAGWSPEVALPAGIEDTYSWTLRATEVRGWPVT